MSNTMFLIVQAAGLLGSVIVISGMQKNDRRVILLCQLIGCICWMFHYGMLGATTAVYTNVISFGRSLVFVNNDKPWARSRLWLWFFIALLLLNSILTWDGWISILPAISMTLTSVALWTHNTRTTRLLMLINSPFWLVYDLWCRSYTCAVVEVIAFISFIIAIRRFDFPVKGADEKEKIDSEKEEKN